MSLYEVVSGVGHEIRETGVNCVVRSEEDENFIEC